MVKIFKVFVPVSVLALIFLEGVLLYGSYIGGLYFAELSIETSSFAQGFLLDENGWIRILIVVLTIMLGLYFNDLYENIQVRSRIQLFQQICFAVGVAFFTQAFMGYLV